MAHFRCLIRREGFLGILEGRDSPISFYVNRPVEADDAEQARRAVLDAFHAELAERGWADRGGRVVVDEIDEIDASELPSIGQASWFFRMRKPEPSRGRCTCKGRSCSSGMVASRCIPMRWPSHG